MAREPERNDFSPWVGVVNQAPLVSTTNVFRLEHMLAARPSAVSSRQVTVSARHRRSRLHARADRRPRGCGLGDFRGRPVLMRFTRAVTDQASFDRSAFQVWRT